MVKSAGMPNPQLKIVTRMTAKVPARGTDIFNKNRGTGIFNIFVLQLYLQKLHFSFLEDTRTPVFVEDIRT
jgi:hypothetical protein